MTAKDLEMIFAIMTDDLNGNYAKLGKSIPEQYLLDLYQNTLAFWHREGNNK